MKTSRSISVLLLLAVCASLPCTHAQVPVVEPKQGICPEDNIVCVQAEDDLCTFDSECEGAKKCCYNRCGKKCVDAVTAHAGFCPTSPFKSNVACTLAITKVECTDDSTCAIDEKCCKGLVCLTKCVKAVTEKSGACPKQEIICDLDPLPRHCNSDGDCPDSQKCCTLPCGFGCRDPVGLP